MRDYLIMLDDVKARDLATSGASAEQIAAALVKGGVDLKAAKRASAKYLETYGKPAKSPKVKTPKGEGEKTADPLA